MRLERLARLDGRSDIFSLGAVLYEMVSGIRAFERDSGVSALAAILHLEPPHTVPRAAGPGGDHQPLHAQKSDRTVSARG